MFLMSGMCAVRENMPVAALFSALAITGRGQTQLIQPLLLINKSRKVSKVLQKAATAFQLHF